MILHGFHRGLTSWVATFKFGGFEHISYLDRSTGRWEFAKRERYDVMTLSELDIELTEKLKEWLKEKGIIPKSNEEQTAPTGLNQGEPNGQEE